MKRCWTALPSVTLLLGLVLAPALPLGPQAPPAIGGEPAAGPEVERRIEDLGNEDFKVREAAMQALRDLEEVVPALRRALDSPDAEVRRRVAVVVAEIGHKRAHRGLTRAQALAKEGRIIEAVERIVAFARSDRDGLGGPLLTGFADKVLELKEGEAIRKRRGFQLHFFPAGDFHRYVKRVRRAQLIGGKISYERADIERLGPAIFARAEEISFDPAGFGSCLLAVTGDVFARGPSETPKLAGCFVDSFLLAGGNVSVDGAAATIIVSEGDVEVRGGASGCLIFARGDIKIRGCAGKCLLVARGKVTGKCMSCAIRAEDYFLDPEENKKVAVKEGDPDRFAFLKFFELSDVGLTMAEREGRGEAVQDGVCIREVRKDSTFSPALQAGDVVTAIDGTKAASPEAFRRLLRKRLAQGGPWITFTVRRAGQTAGVAVPVKD
jgi:hypothetical protein